MVEFIINAIGWGVSLFIANILWMIPAGSVISGWITAFNRRPVQVEGSANAN
jgi:hypothetical protein